MNVMQRSELDRILEAVAAEIDISPSARKRAEERYNAVGDWLDAPGNILKPFDPLVYVQGSMRHGTVVRPINDRDEYDIDLVCELRKGNKSLGQLALKGIVGDRLRENSNYARMMCPEGGRCWTIEYADEVNFHLDVLPAIADPDWDMLLGVVDAGKAQKAILITDRNQPHLWPNSNPEGYAEWFDERCSESRHKLFRSERMVASVSAVPKHDLRSPLQRIVQLSKRHRDNYFSSHVKSDLLHPDNKPSSIVLTTLVGIAYQMEEELANTFVRISRTLADPIENRDGVFWLSNPVDPRENLVRQWKENDRLRLAFYSWTRQLADDFGDLLELRGLHNVADRLKPTLGTHSVERAFKSIGNELRTLREEQKLFVVGGTGTLSSISGVVVPEHRFHGD